MGNFVSVTLDSETVIKCVESDLKQSKFLHLGIYMRHFDATWSSSLFVCFYIYAILGIWSVISSWKHVRISNVLNTQKLHLSLSRKKQEESYKKTILLLDDCICVFWSWEIISIIMSFILLYTIHIYMLIGLVLSFL